MKQRNFIIFTTIAIGCIMALLFFNGMNRKAIRTQMQQLDSLHMALEHQKSVTKNYQYKSSLDELYIEGRRDSALSLYRIMADMPEFQDTYKQRLRTDSLWRLSEHEQFEHFSRLSKELEDESKLRWHLNTALAKSTQELADYDQNSCNLTDSISALFALIEELRELQSELLNVIEIDKGENQVVYIGHRADGMAHGYGIGYWSSGSLYKGDWFANMRHGTGWYQWKDGDVYEGDFENDKRTGKGVYTWKDGEQYRGEWNNNMREGFGAVYYPNGKLKYEGNWKADKFIPAASKVMVENEADSSGISN